MSFNPLRKLPSVGELMESQPLKGLVDRLSHNVVVNTVRTVLDEMQKEVHTVVGEKTLPNVAELAERIARRVLETAAVDTRPAINATGSLLHSVLGDAPLADDAVAAMIVAARDYGGLAVDPNTGNPVRRSAAVEPILHELTGAESALVVGTSAGALLVALSALSAGKETVVARGQMLETDDGCRMADLIAQSGAVLREVGSVNVVRAEDYAAAIGEKTGALLVADASSHLLQGRVEMAGLAEVAEVGRKQRIPTIYRIDAGSLVDSTSLGLPSRPTIKACIDAGADVVIFSGDKLVGGPSCGILLGRRASIEKIQKHPLAQAMQADKITLAALSATLQLYRDEEKAKQDIPLLRLLGTSVENLKNRAERLAPQMAAVKKVIASAEAVEEVSHYLGSAIPSQAIPTWCIALTPHEITVERLAASLRAGTPSVVGRAAGDRYLLDLRSVFPRQDIELVTAVEALG